MENSRKASVRTATQRKKINVKLPNNVFLNTMVKTFLLKIP